MTALLKRRTRESPLPLSPSEKSRPLDFVKKIEMKIYFQNRSKFSFRLNVQQEFQILKQLYGISYAFLKRMYIVGSKSSQNFLFTVL